MATESGTNKKRNIFVRIGLWFKNAALELGKTTWPTFAMVMKKLGIVCAVVLFFFVILFAMDLLLNLGYDALTSGLGESTTTTTETAASILSTVGNAVGGLFGGTSIGL